MQKQTLSGCAIAKKIERDRAKFEEEEHAGEGSPAFPLYLPPGRGSSTAEFGALRHAIGSRCSHERIRVTFL
ncbi:hypothetical protein GOP47_0009463 [Adiantum capillus-veneris]|uniref:Uncharacterized protein n=1 Tax=Adiantum capillus-veneris TaxID=13818 RepID=A0A9D4UXU4_ADICA|nr:hypothetical protein GOP47_0009463 [Adiantum capillus-veneris]